MSYHLLGLMSAFFMLLSLGGIFSQAKLVWNRKRDYAQGKLKDEKPTEILSLNRFATSFLAFFSMFFYGLTLETFNHYIVWPRITALLLLLFILFEINNDRKNISSKIIFITGTFLVISSIVLALSHHRVLAYDIYASHIFALTVTFIFAQGAFHQIIQIRKSGKTGALSLRMHQLFAIKDFTSMLFGIAMELDKGWPVAFHHMISFFVQVITMYHFRWVKYSPIAKSKRGQARH